MGISSVTKPMSTFSFSVNINRHLVNNLKYITQNLLFYVIATGLLLLVMHFVKYLVSIIAFVIGLYLPVCYFKNADNYTS